MLNLTLKSRNYHSQRVFYHFQSSLFFDLLIRWFPACFFMHSFLLVAGLPGLLHPLHWSQFFPASTKQYRSSVTYMFCTSPFNFLCVRLFVKCLFPSWGWRYCVVLKFWFLNIFLSIFLCVTTNDFFNSWVRWIR